MVGYCVFKKNVKNNKKNSFIFVGDNTNEFVRQARQNARSDRVCLDFSLVPFFVSRQRKE